MRAFVHGTGVRLRKYSYVFVVPACDTIARDVPRKQAGDGMHARKVQIDRIGALTQNSAK